MTKSQLSPLHQQLGRVNRRLFVQSLLGWLTWCWTGALAVGVVWILLQPVIFMNLSVGPPGWLRWAVAAGSLAVATVLGVVLSVLFAPSRLTAALSFDQKFNLRERVTTSLLLTSDQQATMAGQALLADVNDRVGKLDVREQFPIRLSTSSLIGVAVAVLLAITAICLVVFGYPAEFARASIKGPDAERTLAPVNPEDIKEKINQLKKKPRENQPVEKRAKSEKLEEIQAKLEEIANRPRETREQLRERIKEMSDLQDALKKHEKDMADKAQALKQQLKNLDKLTPKDGPADKLQDALAKGDYQKAQDELKQMAEKLKNNQLGDQDRDKLEKQLEAMKDKLERLARNKDREDELKKLKNEGKLDEETFRREMKQLEQETKQMKDLEDLARQIGECQQCLKDGDPDKAADKLRQAADKLQQMSAQDQDLQDLRDQIKRLQDAKDSC